MRFGGTDVSDVGFPFCRMEGVAIVFVWESVQDDRPIHSGTRALDGANSHVERTELLWCTKRKVLVGVELDALMNDAWC